jgi:hypothetical protein
MAAHLHRNHKNCESLFGQARTGSYERERAEGGDVPIGTTWPTRSELPGWTKSDPWVRSLSFVHRRHRCGNRPGWLAQRRTHAKSALRQRVASLNGIRRRMRVAATLVFWPKPCTEQAMSRLVGRIARRSMRPFRRQFQGKRSLRRTAQQMKWAQNPATCGLHRSLVGSGR